MPTLLVVSYCGVLGHHLQEQVLARLRDASLESWKLRIIVPFPAHLSLQVSPGAHLDIHDAGLTEARQAALQLQIICSKQNLYKVTL